MSSNEGKPSHKKITQFIPYKTMAMDLEAVLANLTRIYVSRRDLEMVELLTACQPELFPVGSYDDEAERYEYVLKLAVPVKFHNHLRDNIDQIQPRLLADLGTVTAPYLHELISEVFVVLKIEQDTGWREAALDWVMEGGEPEPRKDIDVLLMVAPEDTALAGDLEQALARRQVRVARHVFVSVKDKDVHHALSEFEKRAHFGVLVVSASLLHLPFAPETLERILSYLMNPGKRFCQIWHQIERPEVAGANPALARCLALTTARMSVDEIGALLMRYANLD
jgi:hypothetical protein